MMRIRKSIVFQPPKLAASVARLSLLALLLGCLVTTPAHAACTSPAGHEGDLLYNQSSHTYQSCNGTLWAAWGPGGPTGGSGCSSPAGNEGDLLYNQGSHTYQFCNGTDWITVTGGVSQPLAGYGYFVLSKSTWTGNMGDLSGANALCLTELTTNTGWWGYASANAAGYLVSANVKAYLCDDASCNNLNANTSYYFANASNASMGGASFTTNSSGEGPNNLAVWAGPAYFGGDYQYWTGGRGQNSVTQWGNAVWSTGTDCLGWSTASSGSTAVTGDSNWFDSSSDPDPEYGGEASAQTRACNISYHLICYVNP